MTDGTGEGAEAPGTGESAGSTPGDGGAAAGAEAAGATAEGAGAPAAAAQQQTVPIERFRAVIGQRAEKEAQLLQARRELELANATIEEFKKLSAGASGGEAGAAAASPAARAASPAKVPTTAEIEQMVSQEAARQNFTRQCNEAWASGKAAHADFEKVIGDLNALSPVFDPRLQRPVMPQSLVEAAIATGQAHEVLYALGKDSSLADRIYTLTPAQQTVELTRLAVKLEAAKEGAGSAEDAASAQAAASASKAPPPVKPKVTGSGNTAPVWDPSATDKFSTEEWIAKREADVRRAREATRH